MLDEALRAKDERVRKTKRTDDVFKPNDEEEVLEVRQDEYTSLLPRGIIVSGQIFMFLLSKKKFDTFGLPDPNTTVLGSQYYIEILSVEYVVTRYRYRHLLHLAQIISCQYLLPRFLTFQIISEVVKNVTFGACLKGPPH